MLKWIFARASASRCGSFSVGGGHFGWASVVRFVLGRPVSVILHGLVIVDSEGKPVLKAARVEAEARVRFSPVRIAVIEARITDGMWHLASNKDGASMADPFRPIPAGGRDACRAPSTVARPADAHLPVQVRVEKADLVDIDLDLDFTAWRLELSRVTTTFWLSFGPDLRFGCARAVVAGGGRVRIGRRGSRGATTVPFERLVFDSFGTPLDAPSDLALDLASARTGRSDLSGRAIFHRVFPGASPHAPPPGLDVLAHWLSFGHGLSQLQAPWRPQLGWLKPIDGDLRFEIHGPYHDLGATVAVQAPGAHFEAELAQGQAHLSLNFSGADTSSWFEPELRHWLGGHLRGRLLASLRLASNLEGLEAQLSHADLRLDRELPISGPPTISLRVGPERPVLSTTEWLSLHIRRLGLKGGRLQLSGARAAWIRLSANLDANVTFDPSDGNGSRIDARGRLVVASLADWLPTRIVQGRLRATGDLAGTPQSLQLRAHFHPSSRLVIGEQRLRLPSRITATLGLDTGGVEARFWVNPSVSGQLNLRYQPRWLVDAEITLRDLVVQRWLSQAPSLPSMTVSGRIRLDHRESRPLVGLAALQVEGPGLEEVALNLRSEGETISAGISGRVALAPWRALWSPYVAGADGMLWVDARAHHDHRGTRLMGDLVVLRDLLLRSKSGDGPLRLLAGDKLSFEGLNFASEGLRVELPWFHGRVMGRMTVNPFDLPKSIIDAGVAGVLELGELPVKLPSGVTLRGQAAIEAAVSGSPGAIPGPRMHGQVNLDRIRIKVPKLPALVLDGIIRAEGERLSTQRLDLGMASMGHITVGTPKSPAWVNVVSLLPLQWGEVDAPISGNNLVLGGAHAQIEIRDLDVDARLLGSPGARTLTGQVGVSHGTLHLSRAQPRSRSESQQLAWFESLPSGLTLDLAIKGFKQALRVEVSSLPDVTVNLDCRLRATRQGVHWTGRVYGAGFYDRSALQLYSWLYGGDLRHCQLGTRN